MNNSKCDFDKIMSDVMARKNKYLRRMRWGKRKATRTTVFTFSVPAQRMIAGEYSQKVLMRKHLLPETVESRLVFRDTLDILRSESKC